MICDRCNINEATVHLTQAVGEEMTKLHLCESCAQEAGIDVKQTISITDVLLGLDKNSEKKGQGAPVLDVVCATCGISKHEYKKSGSLGCPDCYQAFSDELTPLIKAMQHSQEHVGKMPVHHALEQAKDGMNPSAQTIEDLQASLRQAVKAEQYETAAQLRDQIAAQKSKRSQS